jgi:hypothetical protein
MSGELLRMPAATRRSIASAKATNAPVMDAVRVPPSASMTSQSSQTVRSPRASWSVMARRERPIKRWISWVRPDCFPRAASRAVRSSVARGNMPYSLVTQPLPAPFKKPGTPSSTVAVQMTRVLPSSINTLPSAVEIKSGVILSGRIWSTPRPSARTWTPVWAGRPVFRDSRKAGPV